MVVGRLASLFRSAAGEHNRLESLGDDELEPMLARLVEVATEAYPNLDVDDDVFVPYLAMHADLGPGRPEACQAGDLRLACALSRGDAKALAVFETSYLQTIDPSLYRLGLSRDQLDEVKQRLRHKVLVGDGADHPPKILDYAGRGQLMGWLRASAARTALNFLRDERRATGLADDAELEPEQVTRSPELELLRRRYANEFKLAFNQGLSELAPAQRLLLRQRFLDGTSVAALAALYRIHRITLLRHVTDAKKELQRRTEAGLTTRLGVEGAEAVSILRLVRSELDLSLRRLRDEPD